jgi:hypothetical protein
MYELVLPPEALPHHNGYIYLKIFNICPNADGNKVHCIRNTLDIGPHKLSLHSYTEKVMEDCLDKGFALVERPSYVRFHPNPNLAFFKLQGQQLVMRTDCPPDKALLSGKLTNYYECRRWGWEATAEGPLIWVLATQVARKYTSEVRHGGVQYWWKGKQQTLDISASTVKKLEQKGNVTQAITTMLLNHLKERKS